MYDNMRIVYVLLILLGGLMMIYYLRDNVKSQCCQAVFRINKQIDDLNSGDMRFVTIGGVKNREILENSNLTVDNVDIGLSQN